MLLKDSRKAPCMCEISPCRVAFLELIYHVFVVCSVFYPLFNNSMKVSQKKLWSYTTTIRTHFTLSGTSFCLVALAKSRAFQKITNISHSCLWKSSINCIFAFLKLGELNALCNAFNKLHKSCDWVHILQSDILWSGLCGYLVQLEK